MKSLKPSHREKKRYLLIEGADASIEHVEAALMRFVGILGYAKTSPQFITRVKRGIVVAINRPMLDIVRTSLALSGKDMLISKVSGSVRNVK